MPISRVITDSIVIQNLNYLLYGTIIDEGTGISESGYCWAKDEVPTIEDNRLSVDTVSSLGSFSVTVTDLSPSTKYFFRTYAFEGEKVSYGDVISFETGASQVNIQSIFQYNLDSFAITSTILKNQNNVIKSYGHCWSDTNDEPGFDDNYIQLEYSQEITQYTSNVKSFQEGHKFYIRAFILVGEEIIYSNVVAFTTGKLLFKNSFNTKEEIEIGFNNISINQISYIIDDWEQAQLYSYSVGKGLYINQGMQEGWENNGANFFAIDVSQMPLSINKGSIEFLFTFLFDADSSNEARFFDMAWLLTEHFPNNIEQKESVIYAGWDGVESTLESKYFFFAIENTRLSKSIKIKVDSTNTKMADILQFKYETTVHFAFSWDINGINNSNETMQMYINNKKACSTTQKWDTNSVLDNYLYLGARPTSNDSRDSHFNGVNGIYNYLKIYDFAKTQF